MPIVCSTCGWMDPRHRLAFIAGGWLEKYAAYVSGSRECFGKVQLSSQKISNKGVSPHYPLLRFLVISWQIICTFHFRNGVSFFFSPPTDGNSVAKSCTTDLNSNSSRVTPLGLHSRFLPNLDHFLFIQLAMATTLFLAHRLAKWCLRIMTMDHPMMLSLTTIPA